MSSLVREVLLKFGYQEGGVVAGLNRAEGAIARVNRASGGAQGALGRMGGSVSNVGLSFGRAALGALGLTGGIAGITLAATRAIREVGDLEQSMLKLKLATGENVEEFERLSALVTNARRGLIFDDNDIARAVSMAKVLDLTANEIETLIPVARGMAAVMGQDVAESIQAVGFALETGQVRALRQYGISLKDAERAAKAAFSAPLKDLDEAQRRVAILNAVMEKAAFFADGERKALETLPGATRALKTAIDELLEDSLEPMVPTLTEIIKLLKEALTPPQIPITVPGVSRASAAILAGGTSDPEAIAAALRELADAEMTAAESARLRGGALLNESFSNKKAKDAADEYVASVSAKYGLDLKEIEASKAKEAQYKKEALAIGITTEELKKLIAASAEAELTRIIGVKGKFEPSIIPLGRVQGPAPSPLATDIERATAASRMQARFALGEGTLEEEIARRRNANALLLQSDEELLDERRRLNDEYMELKRGTSDTELALAQSTAGEIIAIDEEMASRGAQAYETRYARAQAAIGGFLSVIDRASQAAFNREVGRQKNILRIGTAALQEGLAGYLRTKGQEAGAEAIKSALLGAQALAQGRFAAAAAFGSNAAQWTAAAAAWGVAANAVSASAARSLGDADRFGADTGAGVGRDRGEAREGRRAFGLTFTRPVENVNITVAVTIQGMIQNFGTGQESTMRDLYEQHLQPLIQEGMESGRLAA